MENNLLTVDRSPFKLTTLHPKRKRRQPVHESPSRMQSPTVEQCDPEDSESILEIFVQYIALTRPFDVLRAIVQSTIEWKLLTESKVQR